LKSIVVYCASSPGVNPVYQQVAEEVGMRLAKNDIRLIYGGGNGGLMGVVANATMQHGGAVTGVIPNFLADLEVAHKELTELHYVETMHERKAMMASMADGVITLPGGYGTLDELFEILAWRQLGIYHGPIGVLNVKGFYDHLLTHCDRMVTDGFLKAENRDLIIVAQTIDELLTKMTESKL
jgi:uncharacterized protein (TIGR00730 family)